MVFVDAQTDKLLNRYSMIHDGLEREIYEQAYTEANKVFDEGDGDDPGTLNEDQRNIHDGSGEAYWFFKNAFGRDSYDDAGAAMRIVNNDPTIECPNANWNSTTTNYCNGVTSDDVVAHEWGHAYTEYTHGLIYQYQSGALNESYSDIWGETVDLINGRMDDDEGDIETKRGDGECSTHTAPPPWSYDQLPRGHRQGRATRRLQRSAPASTPPASPVTSCSRADGDTTGDTSPSDACTPLTNGADDRPATSRSSTAAPAPSPSRSRTPRTPAPSPCSWATTSRRPRRRIGGDGRDASTIPSVRIRLSDRNIIAGELANGPVNVTMKLDESDREDSYRWLMGEDSTAFGGAIRDMWTPTCWATPARSRTCSTTAPRTTAAACTATRVSRTTRTR